MTYSPSYFTARESWRDWRMEAHQLITLAQVTDESRILEIGCGGGGLVGLLHKRSAQVVGVETLDVALNLAHSRILDRLDLAQIGEGNTLPFRNNAFDAIVAQHTIEHLPDVDAALREWLRLLKPGGRIALATPNALYPDPAHFADADHAHIFAPHELRDAVTHAGFCVEACFTVFPFLSRLRLFRAVSVIAYPLFQRAPYFSAHGRTLLLGARKPVNK